MAKIITVICNRSHILGKKRKMGSMRTSSEVNRGLEVFAKHIHRCSGNY